MPILNRQLPDVNKGLHLDLTLVVTVHAPRIRNNLFTQTLDSVWKQTWLPDAISIAIDHNQEGAAITRNRSLDMAKTEWIVFLDSDDILSPTYIQRVVEHQRATGADVVWPWFTVKPGSRDPFPRNFNRQWDPKKPHSFPITALIRREFAVKAGGFPVKEPASSICLGEDFPFWVAVSDAGAKFSHLPERLWLYNHHGKNTSGLGTRW